MQRSDDLRNPADRRPAHLDPGPEDALLDRPDTSDLPAPEDRPDPERGDAITPDPAHADLPADPDTDRADTSDTAFEADTGSKADTDAVAPDTDSKADADSDAGTGSENRIDGHLPDAGPDTAIGVAEVPTTSQPADATDAEPTLAPEGEPPVAATTTDDGPLLGTNRTEFTDRWRELQTSFVDSPADAVRAADVLVSEVVTALTTALADRKQALGDQWQQDADTEELRSALMRYRAVFQRLIEV